MEGLAAAGGVIAVVSLAGQVVQGCNYLRDIFDSAKTAPEDVRSLATELKIIESIVLATPDVEQHLDVLDFCNEKVLKLRNVVEKYGVPDGSTRQRRWTTRLAMALSADKIEKHLTSLREAKGYLESIQNVSAHTENLIKTNEILDSVQQLNASQSESAQIFRRTEHKLDDIEAVTRQTQQALERLADGLDERRQNCATVRDVHSIIHMIRSVEIILHEHLLQGQMTDLPTSISSILEIESPPPTEALMGNHTRVRHSNASKTDSDKIPENRNPGILNRFTQVNQLVDIAITIRYRQGKACVNAIAITDQGFEEADFDTKRRMVKALQDLRLLIWLFTHNTNFGRGLHEHAPSSQITFAFETNIGLSWNFWRWREWALSGRLPHLQPKRLSEFITYVLNRSQYEDSEVKELRRIILPVERERSLGSNIAFHQTKLLTLLSAKSDKELESQYIASRRKLLSDMYANVVRADRTRALQLELMDMWLHLNEDSVEVSVLEMNCEIGLIQTNISLTIEQAFGFMR